MNCSVCSFPLKPYQDRYCSGCGHEALNATQSPAAEQGLFFYSSSSQRQEVLVHNQGSHPFELWGGKAEQLGGYAIVASAPGGEPMPIVVQDGGSQTLEIELQPPAQEREAEEGLFEAFLSFRKLGWPVYAGPPPKIEMQLGDARSHLDELEGSLRQTVDDSQDNRLKGRLHVHGAPAVLALKLGEETEGVVLSAPAEPRRLHRGQELDFTLDASGAEKEELQIELVVEVLGLPPVPVPVYLDRRGAAELECTFFYPDDLTVGLGLQPRLQFILKTSTASPPVEIGIPRITSDGDWVRLRKGWEGGELRGGEIRGELDLDLDLAPVVDKRVHLELEVPFEDLDRHQRQVRSFRFSRVVVEPEVQENVVFDFGTSNSTAAYATDDGQVRVVSLGASDIASRVQSTRRAADLFAADESQLPTAMFFQSHANGDREPSLEFGSVVHEFKFNTIERTLGTAWNFKRYLRDGKREYLIDAQGNDRWLSAVELTTFFLKEARRRFQQLTHRRIGRIYATYPASLRTRLKRELGRAYAEAGMKEVHFLLSEPMGIAMAIINSPEFESEWLDSRTLGAVDEESVEVRRRRFFAVFDFGGGTTDLTLACAEPLPNEQIGYRILARGGDADLCGELVTEQLAELLFRKACEELSQQEGEPEDSIPFPVDGRRALARASEAARLNFKFYYRAAQDLKIELVPEMIKMDRDAGYESHVRPAVGKLTRSGEDGEPVYVGDPAELHLENRGLQRSRYEVSLTEIRNATAGRIKEGLESLNDLIYTFYVGRGDHVDIAMPSQPYYVDFIVLAGNASRYPIVEEEAREVFGNVELITPSNTSIDLKLAVVIGAVQMDIEGDRLKNLDGDGSLEDQLLLPIGYGWRGKFRELFRRGDRLDGVKADEKIVWEVNRRVPELRFFENGDPAQIRPWLLNNDRIKRIGELNLSEYAGQTVSIECSLVDQGKLRCLIGAHEDGDLDSPPTEQVETTIELEI